MTAPPAGAAPFTSTTESSFYNLLASEPITEQESPAGAFGAPPLSNAPPSNSESDFESTLAGLEIPEASAPEEFPGSVSTTFENSPLTTLTLTNFSDLLASEAIAPPASTGAAPSGGLLGTILAPLFGSKSGPGGAGAPLGTPSSPLYTVSVAGPTSGFSGIPGGSFAEGTGGGTSGTGARVGSSGLLGGIIGNLSVSIEKFFANLFGVKNPAGLSNPAAAVGTLYNGPAVPGYGGGGAPASGPLGVLGSLIPTPGAVPGSAPLGTAASPLYTIVVSGAAGSPLSSLGNFQSSSAPGGLGSFLALFQSQGSSSSTALGTAANPMYVIDAEGGSGGGFGGLGSLFGSGGGGSADASSAADSGGDLGDLFGGFMASGGDVDPTKAYIVGERRPEIFFPGQRGHIHPLTDLPGAGNHTTHVNAHFHGVTDMDSFQKSRGQILSELHRTVSIANERNRR